MPSWTRWIIPLIFFLIPLMQFLLRNPPWARWSDSPPVLRQAVLCEEVSGIRPVNPKTVFSLRADRRVVFLGRWTGTRGEHAYSLRWYPPKGNSRMDRSVLVRSGPGGDEFTTTAALALDPTPPLGRWRVEVFLDEEIASQLRFELRE